VIAPDPATSLDTGSPSGTRGGTLLLPEGARLLHIGPHKTGTTALQAAFHLARDQVAAQGVHYAGYGRQPVTAVHAAIGRGGSRADGGKAPNIRHWRWLVGEISRSNARRVFLSSEFFADAEPDAIRRVVADLDPARVHVAVTLRPLARIIPSQWQQYVQNRLTTPFEEWLDAILNQPRGAVTPTFWGRHRHDELVARWADAVGPTNVTVIALDDGDREMILRVFERLLGLSPGTLVPDAELANRSMSLAEIEVIRAFNVAYRAEGLPRGLYDRILHTGAAALMVRRVSEPVEGRLELPSWAVERIGEIEKAMVAAIAASGVRISGDLDSLIWLPEGADGPPQMQVTPDVAGTAMLGVLVASGLARGGAGSGESQPGREPPELFRVSSPQLAIALLRRGRTAVFGRISRLFGRS
jgi:hypothetical protein